MKGRRQVGFWPLLIRHAGQVFGGPEFIWSVIISIPAAFLAASHLDLNARQDAAAAFLVVAAALVAVVFAAMSIFVAVASSDLLLLIEDALDGGVREMMAPFVIATGVQVGSVLVTISYLAMGPELAVVAEETLFGIVMFLGLFALLDLVALARFITSVTAVRAEQALHERGGVSSMAPRRRNGGSSS